MKYIYLGTAASEYELNNKFAGTARKKMVYVQQLWDYSFCRAIQKQLGDDFYVISYQPVPTYPAGTGIFYKKSAIDGLNGFYMKAINLPVIKQWHSSQQVKKEVLKIAKQFPDEQIRVITHTTYLQSILGVNKAKRKCDRIKLISMVPDLPEYSTGDKIGTGSIMQNLYAKYRSISEKEQMNVDGYVCFSELQMKKLNQGVPYTVMEGFVNDMMLNEKVEARELGTANRIYLYAGNLKADSGVLLLAEAFKRANLPNSELWIYGEGELESDIKKIDCESIKLKGLLKREDMLAIEKSATALVNPRPINAEFSKYSFPSKLLEYMASGRPVLTTHLPCISVEYDQYLIYVEDDTVDAFEDGLKAIAAADLNMVGDRAKKFVSDNKNIDIQATKVIDFASRQ